MSTILHAKILSSGEILGVVDTPCFPRKYYGGYVRKDGTPIDTATHNYHYTFDQAVAAIIAETWRRELSEWSFA